MWLQSGIKLPPSAKHMIGSKKVMIPVIWSASGMKSITMLPDGDRFTNFFSLVPYSVIWKNYFNIHRSSMQGSGIILHIYNASSHNVNDELKRAGIKRMEHSPYSPDLAPSDFFLFGFLKTNLEGKHFDSADELFDWVKNFPNSIDIQMLRNVYIKWVLILQQCIDYGGEYLHWINRSFKAFISPL